MTFFDRQKEIKLIIINFIRLLLAGLVIFEFLSFLKIIDLIKLQFTWQGLFITAAVAWFGLEVIAYKYRQNTGRCLHWLIWFVMLSCLYLDAFSDFFHLYANFSWWDQFAHFFISAATCFTLFAIFGTMRIDDFKFNLFFKRGRLKLSLFLAAATAMSLSALYEIEEYVEDLIFHTHRLGSGIDTANDLLMNFGGVSVAVLLIIVYYLMTKKSKRILR